MGALKGILNGAPLPNWVKLIAVGFLLASIWFGQQAAVTELQKGQAQTIKAQEATNMEIRALRQEMRDGLVTRAEFKILQDRTESNARRIDALDDQFWGLKATRGIR